MPYVGQDFGPADPASLETDVYSFDFTPRLNTGETITGNGSSIPAGGLWVLTCPQDSNTNLRLIGSPSVSGAVVSQTIGTLVAGQYEVQVTIFTSSSRTLTAYSRVNCVAPSL
jgi:hypothetical protein